MRKNIYDIIIIGGGIIGLSAAYYFLESGKKILILDQYGLGNTLQSSCDYTRNFRVEYGGNKNLEYLAIQAGMLRKEFEHRERIDILDQRGSLYLGSRKQEYRYKAYQQMQSSALPCTRFRSKELLAHYGIHSNFGFLDHSGGILNARYIMQLLTDKVKQNADCVIHTASVGHVTDTYVSTSHEDYYYDQLIIATGCRSNQLIHTQAYQTTPELQVCINFTCNDIQKYLSLPMFIYPESGYYGGPVADLKSIKMVTHNRGKLGEDIHRKHLISKEETNKASTILSQFFPKERRQVASTNSCFYNNSKDKNFLIGRLNSHQMLATGGSGHAFKFGLLIGKYIYTTIMGKKETGMDIFEKVFCLKRPSLH